ncbi:MAG: hypothetical protein KAQ67_08785 [Gammaproteobacteria bacterium]|nr:hypothetical protein [Gammaproteobacteria bacterium]
MSNKEIEKNDIIQVKKEASKENMVKKRPTKEQAERMSRILKASIESGMTPGELEDACYREMFE